jgi:hypothetical protein
MAVRLACVKQAEPVEVEPVRHGPCGRQQATLLGARQAGGTENVLAGIQNRLRRQGIEQRAQPAEYGVGAGARYLLGHENRGEAAEAGLGQPQRNVACLCPNHLKPAIQMAQCVEAQRDMFGRFDALHRMPVPSGESLCALMSQSSNRRKSTTIRLPPPDDRIDIPFRAEPQWRTASGPCLLGIAQPRSGSGP